MIRARDQIIPSSMSNIVNQAFLCVQCQVISTPHCVYDKTVNMYNKYVLTQSYGLLFISVYMYITVNVMASNVHRLFL